MGVSAVKVLEGGIVTMVNFAVAGAPLSITDEGEMLHVALSIGGELDPQLSATVLA